MSEDSEEGVQRFAVGFAFALDDFVEFAVLGDFAHFERHLCGGVLAGLSSTLLLFYLGVSNILA